MISTDVKVSVRDDDKDVLCRCGGKVYPVGTLVSDTVINVRLYCYACNNLVRAYARLIRNRKKDV